ncbi:hypothetical protein [Bradyrhizobium tunisiense]|uniref:hypothetical protein n=1 Tax=Bradyrhizobium tunisiense TaxID=3278709 RepID=UPI0035E1B9C8
MSRTTPWSFYDLFVVPNLQDFLDDPTSIRKSVNAAVSAFQMADIMYKFYERSDPSKISAWPTQTEFLKFLSAREPSFLTLHSVATAYKHLYTNKGFYEIPSSGDLYVLDVPGAELTQAWQFDERGSPQPPGDVFVRRRGKPDKSMTTALKEVVEGMWPAVLPDESGLPPYRMG